MSTIARFICTSLFMVIAPFCIAADYVQMTVDLDGDKKPEVVVASITGSGVIQKFTIRIGAANYTDEFFAEDGDLPELRIISINRKESQKQLLVTSIDAAGYSYHLLAYVDHKLIALLKSSSVSPASPESIGNGNLTVSSWEGFWKRREIYHLEQGGTRLSLLPQKLYSVWVSGAAIKNVLLDPAECKEKNIQKGGYLRVEKYDPVQHRYFIKAYGGVCGWIQEKKLNDKVVELPWAG